VSFGMGGPNWMTLRSFSRDDSVKDVRLAPGTIRRIIDFARPYRGQVAVFLALVVIDALLVVATPLLLKTLVDNGVLRSDHFLVTVLALVVAGLAVFDAVFSLLQRWYSARIGEGLIYDMRSRVFAHVQRMPIAFFTRTQTGSLVSRLNNDVIGAQQAFTSTLSGVVSNVISLVLVTATMIYLSWQVTLLSLLMLPVFLVPAKHVGRRLQALARQQMQLNAAMSTTMTERFNVSGALLVKLFGRPAEEDEQFADKAARVRDIGVRIAMSNRVFFTALTLVASLATALVYGIGGHLVISQQMTVGTLLALAALLGRMYGPLTALSNVRVDVMTALVSFERVFEVLDLPPMISEKPDAVPLPRTAASVEFDHVSFRYPTADEVSLASLESVAILDIKPSQQVLYDVSFRAEPGQLVALVGPSGAGKTTISHLVARLYDVTGGAVRIGGIDVRDATLESLHDVVGVVTQDAHMFHDTIRANLLYARPSATEAELVEACRAAQIWDLVATLPDGLDTVVGDRGYRLSGGEKQRLALARLLLKAPGVVVLDEATAHLDSESEVAVQRALKNALAGRTSIVIAHRLSTIREADLILVVDEGRIVERGTHQDLLARGGLYADLYRTQFERQVVDAEPAASPPGKIAAGSYDGSYVRSYAADRRPPGA
jgi:ATP-binding cassette, subfamily B, bacterial